MSAKHPYISGAGSVATMVTKLRSAFPNVVNSETVKKLGLAPNNESYVINALQFVGAIDEEGKKTEAAANAFSKHSDSDFQDTFGDLVRDAYSDLFELHGDSAWQLSKDELITFFRNSDQTSAIIGGRQANLFQTFAALSGHGELKLAKPSASAKNPDGDSIKRPPVKGTATKRPKKKPLGSDATPADIDVGLSVRIEVNLPADASPDTYDAIFASIRKNLIDQ